uniref:Uncharacterized protein n=1 Tax=viral metagenome TaxID=1070528 RepID=A0A6C0BKS4_9ZZZZ
MYNHNHISLCVDVIKFTIYIIWYIIVTIEFIYSTINVSSHQLIS